MNFINSEVNDIDLEAYIFQNFQNPRGTNLDFQVKMCFASKLLPQGNTVFTELDHSL